MPNTHDAWRKSCDELFEINTLLATEAICIWCWVFFLLLGYKLWRGMEDVSIRTGFVGNVEYDGQVGTGEVSCNLFLLLLVGDASLQCKSRGGRLHRHEFCTRSAMPLCVCVVLYNMIF